MPTVNTSNELPDDLQGSHAAAVTLLDAMLAVAKQLRSSQTPTTAAVLTLEQCIGECENRLSVVRLILTEASQGTVDGRPVENAYDDLIGFARWVLRVLPTWEVAQRQMLGGKLRDYDAKARRQLEQEARRAAHLLASREPRRECCEMPVWDVNAKVIRFRDKEHHYRTQAENQWTVLNSFQEEGWNNSIDDPLPVGKRSETIRTLNDTLSAKIGIRIEGPGDKEKIRWSPG